MHVGVLCRKIVTNKKDCKTIFLINWTKYIKQEIDEDETLPEY